MIDCCVQLDGFKLALDRSLPGIDAELLHFKQHREKYAYEFLVNKFLAKDDICLDIGANIGFYALTEALRAKKVFAFEPVQTTYMRLQSNIALNNIHNIETYMAAVRDHSGSALMEVSDRCNTNRIARTSTAANAEVSIVTLDECAFNKDVTFVRMDVEGYETHILRGAYDTLHNKNLKLMIEFHPHMTNYAEFISILRKLKFKIAYMCYDTKATSATIRLYQRIVHKIPKEYCAIDWNTAYNIIRAKYGWCSQLFLQRCE